MVILELVGQGIKGIPPALRVSLSPGYTLFQCPQGGVSLWSIFDALCFPDPRAGGHAFLASPSASVARLGLTFQGRDGQTYRVVREIGGPGTLAKMDAATGKFVGITRVADELTQFLRSTVGVPTRGTYESVFTLNRGQFPSAQPTKPTRPTTGNVSAVGGAQLSKVQGLSASAYATPPVADVAVAQKQLEELKVEFAQTQELEDLQFRLDGAQRRIFESGGRVKAAEKMASDLVAAKAAMETAPSLESMGLPANVGERVARMETMEKNRDEQINKLDAEREQFLGSIRTIPPLYQDQGFIGGSVAGVAVVGLAFALGHAWRYLALMDMPAFGVAAVFALRWVTDLQSNEGVTRRKLHYDDRERQIRDGFETEMLSVRTAMKLLQVENTTDLLELLGRRQVLESQVRQLESQLRQLETDPAYAAVVQDAAEAHREVATLEARIAQLSSFTRASTQVESEIAQLQEGIKAALGPKTQAAPAAADFSASPTMPNAPLTIEDPFPKLLGSVTDLFSLDIPSLGQLLAPRAAQYLMALTDRRITAVEFSATGAATLVSSGGRVGLPNLAPAERDLVYLALRLTLMEKAVEKQKVGILLDDPLADLDVPRAQLIGRMLKHLGSKSQVFHVAQQPVTAASADAQVDLAV